MTQPLFTAFCFLAATTLALALYRLLVVRGKGDDCLHLMDSGVVMIDKQAVGTRRLETIDVWGKTLTILTLLSGVAAYCAWWIGAH